LGYSTDQAVFPQREQLQRGYGKNGKENERTAQQAAQKNARVRDTNGGVFLENHSEKKLHFRVESAWPIT